MGESAGHILKRVVVGGCPSGGEPAARLLVPLRVRRWLLLRLLLVRPRSDPPRLWLRSPRLWLRSDPRLWLWLWLWLARLGPRRDLPLPLGFLTVRACSSLPAVPARHRDGRW